MSEFVHSENFHYLLKKFLELSMSFEHYFQFYNSPFHLIISEIMIVCCFEKTSAIIFVIIKMTFDDIIELTITKAEKLVRLTIHQRNYYALSIEDFFVFG